MHGQQRPPSMSSSSSSSSVEDTFERFQLTRQRKHNMNNNLSVILTILNSDQQYNQRTLTPPPNGLPIIIGRAADPAKLPKIKTSAPFQAAPNNAKFHCPVMSRSHAQLHWFDNKPYLQDSGSTHGTWYLPNKVFITDQHGRKTRTVSHTTWEKIPKSLPLQEGMIIRFGRAITNPSNASRHVPLEVKVRFPRPTETFKPGTYGLKDSHLNSSDDSEDDDRSVKTRDETVNCSPLKSVSKKRAPEAPNDQRAHSTQADPNSDLTRVAQNISPPDSTSSVNQASPSKLIPEARKVEENQPISSNVASKSAQSSNKDLSSALDRPLPTSNPGPKTQPQSGQPPSPISSSVSSPAKTTEEVSVGHQNKTVDEVEDEGEHSNEIEEADGQVELQCTYGAREAHRDTEEEDHVNTGYGGSSIQDGDSNAEDKHSEEDYSEDAEDSNSIDRTQAAPDKEVDAQPRIRQAPDVERKARQSENRNQVAQIGAHDESEGSANEESLEESSSSDSCQELPNSTVSVAVDSVEKKHASKSFKDVSVVTTITSQTQFTESLNQLPESLAKTVQPPKLRRLHKSSGEQEVPTNRTVLGGNSAPNDAQAVVDASPVIQSKRKRPADFDEEETGNLKGPSSSRKIAKRAAGSVCPHCSLDTHPAKKTKLSSKLASAAQSIAIFALGGVATVAGILALENVIE